MHGRHDVMLSQKAAQKRTGKSKEGANGQDIAAYLQKIYVVVAGKDGQSATAAESATLQSVLHASPLNRL